MSTNLFKYLIPATQKGLEAGFAEGNRQLDEQNRFAQQEQLHQQTLNEDALRQQRGFDQADKLGQARFNQQDALENKKSQEKINQDKAKEDAKQKKLQDEAGVRTGLLQGINPKTNKKYSYNEMLGDLPNSGFTPSEQVKFSESWGAPGGLTEKEFPTLNKKDGTYTNVKQKWDAKSGSYKTYATSEPKQVHEKGTNGENVMAKGIQKQNNQSFIDLLGLQDDLKKLSSGQKLLDSKGKEMTKNNGEPYTVSDIQQEINDAQDNYANKVKTFSSDNFMNWYNQIYNKKDSNGKVGNPNPQYYWHYLKEAHREGDLDEADFQNGVSLFQATYGFNPMMRYGS